MGGDQGEETGGFPEPGDRLGDLELLREVGRGGQGVVFEARQLSLDRRVAVKLLPVDPLRPDEAYERFRLEARALARLTHPNIVRIYSVERHAGFDAIVQEFVSGGVLKDRVEDTAALRTVVDEAACRAAAETCRQLAEALHDAHMHGVVHRDVKPANVLLTEDGTAKLTDFGLAILSDAERVSRTGAIVGSPSYMAPEQVDPTRGEMDARTDVYALGATLYCLLTGRAPFDAKTVQGLFIDILTRPPRSPRKLQASIPADLEAVCLRALEKSPEQRYATALDFAQDLQRYLEGRPTLARPVGPVGHLVRGMRRMGAWSLGLLAMLIAVVWLAFDNLVLEGAARQDVDVHWLRMFIVLLAACLAAWPMALLLGRVLPGRRWATLGAGLLLLGAGFWQASDMAETRTAHLHGAAHADLASHLGEDRIDIGDVETFVAEWEARFTADDCALVAHALLTRQRPEAALAWARRLEQTDTQDPFHWALAAVVEEIVGDAELARVAAARRDELSQYATWKNWHDIGVLLREVGRPMKAYQAFALAEVLPGVDRDVMNLQMAGILIELCRRDEADEYLAQFRKFHETDPRAIQLALRLAREHGDTEAAATLVERLESLPGVSRVEKLAARFEHHGATSDPDDRWEFVDQVLVQYAEDPRAVEWCGRVLLQHATSDVALADRYRAGEADALLKGQANDAKAYAGAALKLEDRAAEQLEKAWDAYSRLKVLTDSEAASDLEFIAEAGLGNVAMNQSMIDREHAESLLRTALAHTSQAAELDPGYYVTHYNLGLVRRKLNGLLYGERRLWPEGALAEVFSGYRHSLDANGLQLDVINNAADTACRLFEQTGDADLLDWAVRQLDLGLRVLVERMPGSCPPSANDLVLGAILCDTRRDALALSGDLEGALASQRQALEFLPEDHPLRPTIEATLADLESKLPPR